MRLESIIYEISNELEMTPKNTKKLIQQLHSQALFESNIQL